jgi:hypothetical protein
MINKGSEWRKWDLHVHTPATLCSDYGGNNDEIWKKYFEELERLSTEKNIKVLGINDYFFLEGYEKVLKYKKNGGLKNVELLLPVVEIRLKEFVGNKDLGRINYHIIFADDSLLKVEQINAQFLSSLIGKGTLDVQNPNGHTWGGVITRETLIDLGNHIIQNTPIEKRTNTSTIDVGFNNLNFELSDIINLLGEGEKPNIFLKDKYFKAIGKAEWGDFRWEQSPLEKKSIINSTHFVFSASPTVEMALAGKESLIEQGVNSRLLHCSDSHSFAKDTNNTNSKELGHCFTWIKAQPTFEGLKQIIYEPDERVRIQKEKPESEKLDNLIIERVTFTSSNNKFTPEPIYFNKNLNVIIGGKSSGKSILLYEIAKTLYENQSDSVLKYKDSNNNQEKDLYNLQEDDPQFNFIVETFLGTQQSIKRESNQASILPSIKYIPQNHLSNLVDKSKQNSNELKKYIRELIREIPQYDKIYNDFIEKLKQNDKIRENDISEYFTYKEELVKKKGELQQKGDKETIKKSIEALEKKIAETKKNLTPEQSTGYTSLSLENSELNKIKNSLINDFEKLNNFSDAVRYTLNELKAKKTLLLDNLELDNIKNDFTTKLKFIDDAILENDNIKKLITKDENENFQIIEGNIFSSEFKRINQSIEEVKEKLTPYTNLFENQKLILSYQNTISEEKIKLSDIEQIEKEIENIIKTANERKSKIFEDIRNNRKLYDNLLTDFAPRIEKIKEEDSELKIEGKIHFNFPKYRESVLSISHGNSKSYLNYNIFNEENEALIDYDFENYLNDLKAIFDSIENGTYSTLKDVTKQRAISLTLEQKWFFDNWDITYKNDTIHKMSTGKASLVLLKVMIKLSAVKGPILIDQPEDNLDNRSVTNELIAYLKDKKKERQIILVTHNANIVVNADAENIIVANQRGQSEEDKQGSPYLFDYINGAIEDIEPLSKEKDEKDLLKSMGIREHITQIVEGGRDAFKKREEKYGF